MFFVGVLGVSLALSLIGMVVLRRHFIVVHTSEVFQFIGLSTKIIRRVLVLDSSPTLDLAKVVLVERLGKFDRLLKPGLHFLMPLLESTKFVTYVIVGRVIRLNLCEFFSPQLEEQCRNPR